LGTLVPVSNPVPQRLTAFFRNASFSEKNLTRIKIYFQPIENARSATF